MKIILTTLIILACYLGPAATKASYKGEPLNDLCKGCQILASTSMHKTQLCINRKLCPYGTKCDFAHSENEVLKTDTGLIQTLWWMAQIDCCRKSCICKDGYSSPGFLDKRKLFKNLRIEYRSSPGKFNNTHAKKLKGMNDYMWSISRNAKLIKKRSSTPEIENKPIAAPQPEIEDTSAEKPEEPSYPDCWASTAKHLTNSNYELEFLFSLQL